MFESSPRSCLRDRILNELKNTIKQIFIESTKDVHDVKNKVFLCHTLIRNLEAALLHGLKNLQNGYWYAVKKITHPLLLENIKKLPRTDNNKPLINDGVWIILALNENSLSSYLECFVRENGLSKYYEDWSIVRHGDSAQKLISLVCGLDNIYFDMKLEYLNILPQICDFRLKESEVLECNTSEFKPASQNMILSLTGSVTSLGSPVDSGVVFGDSESDLELLTDSSKNESDDYMKTSKIDLINGNITPNEFGVVLRKKSKNVKKRVSFHENCKSPETCRRLKWDCESLRYSWSGESDINCYKKNIPSENNFDVLKFFTTNDIYNSKNIDKGVDVSNEDKDTVVKIDEDDIEANEPSTVTPQNSDNILDNIKVRNKSIIVKRFLHSIKQQKRNKKLVFKSKSLFSNYSLLVNKTDIPKQLTKDLNDAINSEIKLNMKQSTIIPEILNRFVPNNSVIFKYFTIPHCNQIVMVTYEALVTMNITKHMTQILCYNDVDRIVIYPNYHKFMIFVKNDHKELSSHLFTTGLQTMTENIIGSIEYCMRIVGIELPFLFYLDLDSLKTLHRSLCKNNVLKESDVLMYYGNVFMDEPCVADIVGGVVKEGTLMYKLGGGVNVWMPVLCSLSNGVLEIKSECNSSTIQEINLSTSHQCRRTTCRDRPHTFELAMLSPTDGKPKHVCCQSQPINTRDDSLTSSSVQKLNMIRDKLSEIVNVTSKKLLPGNKLDTSLQFEFAASDEYELSDWLQAFLFATSDKDSCERSPVKESSLEQTVVMTSESLITFRENQQPTRDLQITLAAALTDLAVYQYGGHRGYCYCVLEFSCMEASSNISGDCVLYFVNEDELDKFKSVLSSLWCGRNDQNFPSKELTDVNLITHCNKIIDRLFFSNRSLV